jgi:hypothetical protein
MGAPVTAERKEIHDAQSHFILGLVMFTKGETQDAKVEFDKTLRLNPGHDGARYSLENSY